MDIHYEPFDPHPLIVAKDFTFTYENSESPACQVPQVEIYPGECVVLCGPSGSGKSTFLKLVNGLIPDYHPGKHRGSFVVGNFSFGEKSVEDFSYQVASVFQNPATQFFHRKVKHELVFPCENQGECLHKIREKLNHVGQTFSLEDKLEQDIFTLSGGEKERVALGTALMQSTEILVFDEPTANLDRQGIDLVAEQLASLKKQGKTLLVAEHRLDYLSPVADRYLYFDQGKLIRSYGREEFLALSESVRKGLSLRSLSVTPFIQEIAEKSQERSRNASPLLEIRNLQVRVGDKILKEISELDLAAGQILGIIGPNGRGKSTFAHYLTGLLDHKGLSISYKGQPLSNKDRLKKVALVMQEVRFQLFSESVRKELLLGLKEKVDFQDLVQQLKLAHLLDRHPMTLSGGEQQRLVIASSLLSQKELFIFDEPTSGLDYQQMREVASLLLDLKAKGKIVFLISHDEELLANVCDLFLSF